MKFSSIIYSAAFAAIIMSSCSSDDTSENKSTGRHQRMLTITQNEVESSSQAKIKVVESEWGSEKENSVNGPRKSVLIDQGDAGLKATWEMGDEMTVYNKSYPSAGYAIVKATSTAKNTTFMGAVDCEEGDVIRLFYPKVSESGSVTDPTNTGTLTLDISSQKGTLEDIQQHYDFNYGQATVTAVTNETATANAESTENLMAICKFTFKCDNQYLKQIKKIVISGVAPTATYTLGARSTPTLAPNATSTVTINNDGLDNCIYVALFPGATTPTFSITTKGGIYEGTLTTATLTGGKFYNVTINTTKTSGEYIEVCGIKWAKGNLIYDPVNGGDDGFEENWRIAPSQWFGLNYNAPYKWNYITNDNEIKDVFNYGYLGDESFCTSNNAYKYVRLKTQDNYSWYDISTKYFYSADDRIDESNLVNNRSNANRGDLAYWASFEKYRLPRESDFLILQNEASYQFGYINISSNKIYGMLFWTPDVEKVNNTSPIAFEESDLEKGLFLPILYSGGTDYAISRISNSSHSNFEVRVINKGNDNEDGDLRKSSTDDFSHIRPILCE